MLDESMFARQCYFLDLRSLLGREWELYEEEASNAPNLLPPPSPARSQQFHLMIWYDVVAHLPETRQPSEPWITVEHFPFLDFLYRS